VTYKWFADVDPVTIVQRQFIKRQEIVFKAGFTPYNIAHAACNVFFKDKDDRILFFIEFARALSTALAKSSRSG